MKSSSAARLAEMELSEDDTDKRELILLGEIDAPSPVFFCSVEPASAAFQKGAVSTHLSHNMGGGGVDIYMEKSPDSLLRVTIKYKLHPTLEKQMTIISNIVPTMLCILLNFIHGRFGPCAHLLGS